MDQNHQVIGPVHGDLIPVPEMFDPELNGATTERMNYSVLRPRHLRHRTDDEDDDQRSVFCRTCRNNHRLTYQIMGDFLPDDDHPDYERLLGNIENKRKALEQRYPPVCDECLPKVEQVLANQRTKLKTNLFNVALRRGKVDHIRSKRKYPRLSWIMAALIWMCGNICLLVIHYYDAGLLDLLSSLDRNSALKHPALAIQGFIKLAASTERLDLVICALAAGMTLLVFLDFFWNPVQFSLDRSPNSQLRTRRSLNIAQILSIPLRAVQCWSLYSLFSSPPAPLVSACLVFAHIGFCVAFLSGRYVRNPVTVQLGSARSPVTRAAHGREEEEREEGEGTSISDDERYHVSNHRTRLDPSKKKVNHRQEEDNPFISRTQPNIRYQSPNGPTAFPSSAPHPWDSRSSSPDNDNINWSPRKPRQSGDAGLLPPQFGMYRDPDNQAAQHHGMNAAHQQDQGHVALNARGLQPLNQANKFHSRAYEPSPLAHPSMIMDAAQQGTSLGEMFGFPSARFQPPENHFAHRSAAAAPQDMWTYRRRDESHSRTSRPTSLLDDEDTYGMDDDDDDDAEGSDADIKSVRHTRSKPKHKRKESTSDVDDLFGSFGFASSSAAPVHRGLNQKNKRDVDMFGQQRFFPPDGNTGLEDNFWGAVKIEDDELREIPRTREGRNMAMKKRLAIRWLLVGVLSRAVAHVAAMPWITLLAILLFVGVLLHAIGFWIVDQRQSWIPRSGQGELKKFKPVLMDKVFSVCYAVTIY
ncbi:hypothetical protein BGZ73_004212 [Actinomortierella ambigua]|nr:hypothetical protein BGZ73_004212 [Actinomortierella ambigua]